MSPLENSKMYEIINKDVIIVGPSSSISRTPLEQNYSLRACKLMFDNRLFPNLSFNR